VIFSDVVLIGASYILGCLCIGYYLVRLSGRGDIRTLGSGSVGARNVGRVLGRWGFALTLIGDAGKAAIAVGLAVILGRGDAVRSAALIAVAVGHIWPVQLGFRGGRGIAVTLGGLLVYDGRLVLLAVGVFAVLYTVWRKYMACGLLAVVSLPILAACLGYGWGRTLGMAGLVAILLTAHRAHIRRLWEGRKHRTSARSNDGSGR
jgi:acyl phosphate:glycerol-3-phosphate acyltransferase